MLNTQGLALEQAPPFLVPMRLFIMAPLFVSIAGVLLISHGQEIFASRWNPLSLALTHLITLGFLTQIMIGAMLQLLPVLAGAPVPGVVGVSLGTQFLLVLGTSLLVTGFLLQEPLWLVGGGAVLILAFGLFLTATGLALRRASGSRETRHALRLGWAAMLPTLGLGLLLVSGLAGWVSLDNFQQSVSLHLTWGLAGWMGLLLIAVLTELVPMFYVTPAYTPLLRKWLAPGIFSLLIGMSLAAILLQDALVIGMFLISLVMLVFGIYTVWVTQERQRPVLDTTLIYIWIGCGAMVGAGVAMVFSDNSSLLGVLLLAGVALAFHTGVLYKIIPFLCWFHLQGARMAARRFDYILPKMNAFITERRTRWQLYCYLGAMGLLLLGSFGIQNAIALGGLLLLFSSLLLFANILSAMLVYRREWLAIGFQAETMG